MTVFTPREQVFRVQLCPPGARKERRNTRSARHVCSVSCQQGELGWHLLSGAEKSVFQLGNAVGTGSYGIVREAHYRGYKVAVKVLSKKRGNQARGKVLRKLAREIDLWTRLQDCCNVVQLINVLEDNENAYLICELCRGGDLEKILNERGPFSERAAARVVYEALKTVAACHSRNVIHGDVKPANFLMRSAHKDPMARLESGNLHGSWLKSIDFGCSQVVPSKQRLTRKTGTPVFMAPEIFQRRYGLEADLWSVGMMLYQLMASRFPFWTSYDECKKKSVSEVMHYVLHGEIPFDYGPWLTISPEGLDLVQQLTLRTPSRRISAQEALEHAWFKTQLASPPPSQKLAQRSNIIPRVSTKPKQVHQRVPAGDPRDTEKPAQQSQNCQDTTPQESDHHSSVAIWQPSFSPIVLPM